MRAWQFTGVGEPLQLVDLPSPTPGPGQVVVDVRAAGLCHSDVGFVDGHITWMLEFMPIVLGHEVAGVISALGHGVEGFAVGDRVGIAGDGLDAPGIVLNGGFAEQCIGKVEQLVPIPDGVSFVQAASGTDAGMTSYHAVRVVGGVTAGTRVGIIGLGGLGLTGARIAVVAGAEVYAAEVEEGKHAAGLAAGVTAVVSDAKELADFDLDVIVDFAGFGTTTAAAVEAINPGGRVVQVGLGADDMTISNQSLVSKQVQLVGSLGGKKADTEAVYALMAGGDLAIVATDIPFDNIDQGIERLRSGGVHGRLVAVIDPAPPTPSSRGTDMTETATREQDLLAKAVGMFVTATPAVGAPISDWRDGFEAMCATFDLPDDAVVEEVLLGGVPGRKVTAPGAATDGRVIVHFHSGGYVMGSSQAYRNFAYRLSVASGVPVIVPDYRLAPEHPFPSPVEDAVACYRALLADVAPTDIVISGDSAGGGLAMALLLAIKEEGLPLPAAGFAISPLLDLAGTGESYVSNADSDPLIDRTMAVEMGKVYIGDLDPTVTPLASALYGDHAGLPPLLLLASNSEVLRDDAARLAASVREQGGEATLITPEGMVHIWTLFPFLPQAAVSMADVGGFVRAHLHVS